MEHKRKEQREWAGRGERVRVLGRRKHSRNGCSASSLGPRQKRPFSLCYHIPRLPSLGPQVLSLWTRKANHKENKSPHVFQEILVMKGRISGWSTRGKKGNKEMERRKKKTPIHVFPERCYFLYVNNHFLKILEDEMVGWHHLLGGHKLGQTSGNGQGQGSLVCCCAWVTERRTWLGDWTTTTILESMFSPSPPPKSTKSEGPVRGAAHRKCFPSTLYPGPWDGCVHPGMVSWGPTPALTPTPTRLRGPCSSMLFIPFCPPGLDHGGQSPGSLNG